MKYKIVLLGLFSIYLVGCSSSNAPIEETLPTPDPQAITSKVVDVSVQLFAGETIELNPRSQGGFDSYTTSTPPESTYNFKTSLTLYDGEDTAHELDVYFIFTSTTARSWEIRTKLDDVFLVATDIDNSGNDFNDQNLLFDSQGNLDFAASSNNGIIEYTVDNFSVEQLHLDFTFDTSMSDDAYMLDSIWLSLDGKGFFVTSSTVDSQDRLFTRVGDFRRNADGYLVNRFNEALRFYPVNSDGSVLGTALSSTVAIQIPSFSDTLTHNGTPRFINMSISENGLLKANYNDNSSMYLGKIALAFFVNPQDLLTKTDTSSLLDTIDSGTPISMEATLGGMGTIKSGSLKTLNPSYTELPYNIIVNGEGYFITSLGYYSDQNHVSKQSAYRTDDEGFVMNKFGEFLRIFVATDGVIDPEINSLDQTILFHIPAARGAPKATSEIKLGVNLSSNATSLEPSQFDSTNVTSYNASTSLLIIDSFGEEHLAKFYFLKDISGANQWTIYIFIDDQPIDIIGGISGSQNQLYGVLNFDSVGNIQSYIPFPISFTANFYNGSATQTVQIHFDNSTELPSDFSVFQLDHNGYAASLFLSIDIAENGTVTTNWSSGDSSIHGWIPLVTVDDTSCLVAVSGSESSVLGSTCSYSVGTPGDTGFGTITYSFDEIEAN